MSIFFTLVLNTLFSDRFISCATKLANLSLQVIEIGFCEALTRRARKKVEGGMALLQRRMTDPRCKERLPSEKSAHPVFSRIMADIGLGSEHIVIRSERFEFWSKYLMQRCPRSKHGPLYAQLFAAARLLAPHRCPAALQLFALACLDLDTVSAWRLAREDKFLTTQGAQEKRLQARVMAASGFSSAFQNSAGGVGLRRSSQRNRRIRS